MHYPSSRLCLPFLLLIALFAPMRAHAFGWPNSNDSIFPPLPAAKAYVDFDGKGFLINGKRTFIAAGEFQYARTPRAQWRDRMLRVKRAGYNALQTYVFWNFHEPREGEFDFSGDKDFDAYLKLAHSLGLYVVVRMGPYVNSEWDSGGLPLWLRFKPGLLPMQDNQPFYQAVDPYFAKLVPIIAENQINRGGSVIMVQMENENQAGGGTDLPNPYYQRFHDKMIHMGLQVPIFFSGLNHGDDPAGDSPFDTSQRTSPWYSTEFWTGWIATYNMTPERATKLDRATWKVIAYGGSGYSQYTFVGGTDFDYWNCVEQGAAYDFSGPVGQTGDLRDVYYKMKRAATFATSFPDVIENSLAAAGGNGVTPTNGSIQITNRKGDDGEILFLDNHTDGPQSTQIKTAEGRTYPSAGPITLDANEIMPIVRGYPLREGVNLTLAATHILGFAEQGATTTLVIYGHPGDPAELHFEAEGAKVIQQPAGQSNALQVASNSIILKTKFPQGTPTSSIFRVAGHRIRVLAMSSDMADRTWFLEGGSVLACGPDYVGETSEKGGILHLAAERRGLEGGPSALPQLLYGEGAPVALTPASLNGITTAPATAPAVGAWSEDASVPQAQPGYNDSTWKASDQPLPMGADGDNSAYAWYRTKVTAPSAGTYQLSLSDVGDWITCFVNGKRVDSSDVHTRWDSAAPRQLNVKLNAGANTLAFLTAHYGRNKLYNYYGPMDTIDAKGISGTVTLSSAPAQSVDVNKFRWQADDQGIADAAVKAAPGLDTRGGDWHDATTATDAFNGRVGSAWFRAVLPSVPGPHRRLHFNSIDDNGQIFLNGKQIATNVGVNAGADVSLDGVWQEGRANVLAVSVQNTAGGGGMNGAVTLQGGISGNQEVRGWKMHGGETPPTSSSPTWKPLEGSGGPGVPAFFRTTFSAVPPAAAGPHPILRASPQGLSRGSIWLNGHNLGRYPERSPVDGLYLPESMLLPGKNTLVVFDEDGASPTGLKIVVEAAASRTGMILVPAGGQRTASAALEVMHRRRH